MELPKSIKKLKPNQVVVFDRYYPINDFKANAFFVSEENGICFSDTDEYFTTGELDFYGGIHDSR